MALENAEKPALKRWRSRNQDGALGAALECPGDVFDVSGDTGAPSSFESPAGEHVPDQSQDPSMEEPSVSAQCEPVKPASGQNERGSRGKPLAGQIIEGEAGENPSVSLASSSDEPLQQGVALDDLFSA